MNRPPVIDRILHPQCQPNRRTWKDFAMLYVLFFVVITVLAIFWPSWWLLLIAPIFGLAIVSHPLCFVTHHDHGNRRWW